MTVVIVPFDPEESWSRKPVRLAGRRHGWPVAGTINGVAFEGYVGERWGRFPVIEVHVVHAGLQAESIRSRIGVMRNIQIRSVAEAYEDPKLIPPLLSLYTKADAMGLLPSRPIIELSPTTLRTVLRAYQSNGLLGTLQTRLEALLKDLHGGSSTNGALVTLSAVLKAVDESPVPEQEWPAMRSVFGDDDLAQLLNVSSSSLKRYAAGQRATPDDIAERVHWLAMVVAALSGSYNELGIRRWFERQRGQLDGRSPRRALGSNWNPGSPGAQRIRNLAESLVSGAAT